MSANQDITLTEGEGSRPAADKGKGKAVGSEDIPMEQYSGDSETDESDAADDETFPEDDIEEEDEAGDDNLERISEENIIPGGRRTRGKVINFAEAAEKVAEDDAMDDDDDEEYKQRDEDDEMQG
ncbi:Histone H2A.Z-specific chaperone [Coccidioides posadasii str. Silveira]|uniref:Histone H2A.Z-specific chaperone CHZ1 n=3 Tax=Coccidioides posadasii TaxID=199306 RepID=E9CRM9_COCPS|nr:hypothetical protein CPC735_041120 [Coccidioides posadasii C735 delta SOWgp]EER28848.1 hypothetical protein CPC735_041120 [Coccidioides posadasii C735 delta SOWgp]EFW22456.1 histone H2A.Z-specific chaperone CHZ1 [Coccidioides posadasii str. Silveira]KMM64000.1 hypothetical protein CPAG_00352 [Coccidioides posadasii RMSCC 3488]QVM06149.1 Histone H2A.Z-specific chaperone [Coccidioides posadasii str. Silveira]|eukprot:XP_003070993.1 hypothetical protein CPC735_041120 [Coccidioides posadasii C735 delta SOWgp]